MRTPEQIIREEKKEEKGPAAKITANLVLELRKIKKDAPKTK
jgi:hypothetical protein